MQISRHWRMNAQRYRMEGVRYENGAVNLEARPTVIPDTEKNETVAQAVAKTHKGEDKATVPAA